MSYAGDVSCTQCWKALGEDDTAQLVDVRTVPEWNLVGVPDLEPVGKNLIAVEWQQYPSMEVNPEFTRVVSDKLEACGTAKSSKVYLICRSGVRSIAAAQALTQAGFEAAYNVTGGFEGDHDQHRHRGCVAGWKFDGLPWKQR